MGFMQSVQRLHRISAGFTEIQSPDLCKMGFWLQGLQQEAVLNTTELVPVRQMAYL